MKNTLISLTIILLSSCANVGTLGGGPEDDKAPVLTKTNLTKTNFKDQTIVLEFDEYILTNNPEQNIQILPKIATYKIKSTSKKVSIIFDSVLKENITYNLIINGGIVDNNAGNPFNYNTLFSVSSLIDTSFVKISIPNYKEYKNTKICITKSNGLDSFKKFNNSYSLPVLSDEITFNGIGSGKHNIWLYTDNNSDNNPDLFQAINFIKEIKLDTNYILPLLNWEKPFKIKEAYFDSSKKYIKINYDKIEDISDIPKKINIEIKEFVLISPVFSIIKNNVLSKKLITDTSKTFTIDKDLKEYLFKSIKAIKNRDEYNLEFQKSYDLENYKENGHLNVQRRTLNKKLDTLIVLNDLTSLNDTFNIRNINISEEQKLSHIKIRMSEIGGKVYDIKIFKDDKLIRRMYNINLLDEYFDPGVYKFEIYNRNYENNFNPIIMQKNSDPIYVKVLYLKASWDENLVLKIE